MSEHLAAFAQLIDRHPGWALVALVACYFAWVVAHGWLWDRRRRKQRIDLDS